MSLLAILTVADNAAPLATGGELDIPWIRIIVALIFSLVLAVVVINIFRVRNGLPAIPGGLSKRLGLVTSGMDIRSRLSIVQRLQVTPASQIVLLRRDDSYYLLHLTNQGATVIDIFKDHEESASK